MLMRFVAGTLLLISASCRPVATVEQPGDRAADPLLRKINDRLALMETVAAYKRANGKPIDDPEREAAMLKKLEQTAANYNLSEDEVRTFFSAQIEAAKAVQFNCFARWDREKTLPKETIGLAEIRQRIDELNREMLVALGDFRHQKSEVDPKTIRAKALELIHGKGIDDRVRELAVRPLLTH